MTLTSSDNLSPISRLFCVFQFPASKPAVSNSSLERKSRSSAALPFPLMNEMIWDPRTTGQRDLSFFERVTFIYLFIFQNNLLLAIQLHKHLNENTDSYKMIYFARLDSVHLFRWKCKFLSWWMRSDSTVWTRASWSILSPSLDSNENESLHKHFSSMNAILCELQQIPQVSFGFKWTGK